jgi:hypothetical protein
MVQNSQINILHAQRESHLHSVFIYTFLHDSQERVARPEQKLYGRSGLCLIDGDRPFVRHGIEITGYKLVDGKITGFHVSLKDVSREYSCNLADSHEFRSDEHMIHERPF